MSAEKIKQRMIFSQKDPLQLSSAERRDAMLYFAGEIYGSLMSTWGSMNEDGIQTEADTFKNLEELKQQIDSILERLQTPQDIGKWDSKVFDEKRRNFMRLFKATVSPVLEKNRGNDHGDVPLHVRAMESDYVTASQRFDGLVKFVEQLDSINQQSERIETMRNDQRKRMPLN